MLSDERKRGPLGVASMGTYDIFYCRPTCDPILIHVYGNDFSVIGQVKDLDIEGVACEFVDEGQNFADFVTIDFLVPNEPNISTQGLACKVTQDGPSDERVPFSFLPMRRVELKFESLSEEHHQKLWILLGLLKLGQMYCSAERQDPGRHSAHLYS